MKRFVICAVFICSIATLASGQADTDVRSKVMTLEQVWSRALTDGDIKALDVLADPSLIYVDADGNLKTKSELLSFEKSKHAQRVIVAVTKVQVFDDTAVVNGRYRLRELRDGRAATRDGQFTDTWLFSNSNWVCVAAQSTPILSQVGR